MKILFTYFLSMTFLLTISGQTQQVVATAGGSALNGDIYVEWTLGELIISSLSAGDTVLTQGFHQPGIIVSAVEDYAVPDMSIEVWPNPTQDGLFVHLDTIDAKEFRYVLYDLNGNILDQQLIISNVTALRMYDYRSGLYLLKVFKLDNEIKTFKIIKH